MGFIIEGNELKKYEGNEEVVIIPDEVTSIGMFTFNNLPIGIRRMNETIVFRIVFKKGC